MRIHIAYTAAALVASTGASPLEAKRDLTTNFQAAINAFECRAVNFLVNAGREASSATAFCSSFLSVPVATKTTTLRGSTVTATQTVTAPPTTTTAPASTFSVIELQSFTTVTAIVTVAATQLVTSTVTASPTTTTTVTTQTMPALPVTTTTQSTTVTITRTATVTPATVAVWETCGSQPQKRGVRAAACPTMWQAFASKALSTACACLSISQSTTTVSTSTSTTTTTTSTKTPVVTSVPTVTTTISTSALPAMSLGATQTRTLTTTQTATTTNTQTQFGTVTTTPTVTQTRTTVTMLPALSTYTDTSTISVTTTATVTAPTPTQKVFDLLDSTGGYVSQGPTDSGAGDLEFAVVCRLANRPDKGWYLSANNRLVLFPDNEAMTVYRDAAPIDLYPLGQYPDGELTFTRNADNTLTAHESSQMGGVTVKVYQAQAYQDPNVYYLWAGDSQPQYYVDPLRARGRC